MFNTPLGGRSDPFGSGLDSTNLGISFTFAQQQPQAYSQQDPQTTFQSSYTQPQPSSSSLQPTMQFQLQPYSQQQQQQQQQQQHQQQAQLQSQNMNMSPNQGGVGNTYLPNYFLSGGYSTSQPMPMPMESTPMANTRTMQMQTPGSSARMDRSANAAVSGVGGMSNFMMGGNMQSSPVFMSSFNQRLHDADQGQGVGGYMNLTAQKGNQGLAFTKFPISEAGAPAPARNDSVYPEAGNQGVGTHRAMRPPPRKSMLEDAVAVQPLVESVGGPSGFGVGISNKGTGMYTADAQYPTEPSVSLQTGMPVTSIQNSEQAAEASHWVTVFGFQPEMLAGVLREFKSYGDIIKHVPGKGNWMHIRYKTKLQTQVALSKRVRMLFGDMLVGVTECSDTTEAFGSDGVYFQPQDIAPPARSTDPLATMRSHEPSGRLEPSMGISNAPSQSLMQSYQAPSQEIGGVVRSQGGILSRVSDLLFG